MFKKTAQRIDKVDTVIGPGTVFEGTIKATGIVRIDGKLTGSVETSGDIIVGDQGNVQADVSANNITIAGKIHGNVTAKEKTSLLHKAFVEGDIDTKNIIIEEGAVFKGRCIMGETQSQSQSAQQQQQASAGQNKKEAGKVKAS